MDVAAFFGFAVLADFEFAFNAGDGDAEADDAGQHGAAETVGHGEPFFVPGRIVDLNQALEQSLFAGIVFNEREGSVGVDGDVVPGGNGKLFDVESGRDVTVRAGKDGQGFAAGEGLPVGIGAGEVAFEEAVLAFVFDHKREVGGRERSWRLGVGLRAEENGEGIGLHGLNEDGAVGNLVEFGRVHDAPIGYVQG